MSASAAWVEVDTGAVAHNLGAVRDALGPGAHVCAVVKADAYGHGVDLVAPTLIARGVESFGVTSNEEARTVRATGFAGRILRLRAALREEVEDAAGLAGLRPAMRLVSRIAAISAYPAGRTVGYDRTHRLDAPARLAAVPLGYADGYQRALGGRAEVLVRGRRMPVVDRLAMNTLLVDVTCAEDAVIGDEVVLYGAQGAERISGADLEHASGQIAANLYTSWGRLLPRRAISLSA
ncbi:alanine racemase C-terminal domain-containing protein [Microbacterium laevaniformans]|uniref:alanine racemase C-terminal domain-containing protein n=1 Tax=Microbacterium laevaniformans TaxID=36807 RepID=UPI003D9546A8